MVLLTTNTKLDKVGRMPNGRTSWGYDVVGLAMAPHAKGGTNVCEAATSGCIQSCVLWWSGRTVSEPVREAMLRRKRRFVEARPWLDEMLRQDIRQHRARCAEYGLTPCVRLNVASDLNWFYIAREFPDVTFYDYSKVRARFSDENRPSNYHLTYSLNERSDSAFVRDLLDRGGNVAVVFNVPYNPQAKWYGLLPDRFRVDGKTFEVIDGDRHDVRIPELDGRGIIVGLRLKGTNASKASAVDTGFALTPRVQLQAPTLGCYSAETLNWKGIDAWKR